MRRLLIAAALLAGIMRSQAEPLYAFRAIVPCPGCGALVSGINDTGEIAGSVNNARAFYGSQGHYTIFAEPGAFLTEAIGITNSGRVTVNYLTAAGTGSAYILAPSGSKTVLPQVGNVTLGGNANDTGLAVGFYGADFPGAGGVTAYVDRDGTLDYTFQYPGALVTQALNVNDAGVIVGEWKASLAAMPHGYVRSTDGTMTTVDVPGSMGTEIFDINNADDFAGNFWDAAGRQHGFINRDGVYTTGLHGPGHDHFWNERPRPTGGSIVCRRAVLHRTAQWIRCHSRTRTYTSGMIIIAVGVFGWMWLPQVDRPHNKKPPSSSA